MQDHYPTGRFATNLPLTSESPRSEKPNDSTAGFHRLVILCKVPRAILYWNQSMDMYNINSTVELSGYQGPQINFYFTAFHYAFWASIPFQRGHLQ